MSTGSRDVSTFGGSYCLHLQSQAVQQVCYVLGLLAHEYEDGTSQKTFESSHSDMLSNVQEYQNERERGRSLDIKV